MSVTSGFFNSLNHDRLYDATQMSQIFDGIIRDGVYESIGTCFSVSDNGGLYVNVGIGRAWFNHTWIYNDAILPLALNGEYAPEVLTNRYDAIVLDIDSSPDVREDSIIVVKGTPSSDIDFRDYVPGTLPSSITLINEETHHQYPIAVIERPAGQTSIKGSEIHYLVGTYTPFVSGILEILDSEAFFRQWGSELNEFVDDEEDKFSKWALQYKQEFMTWSQASKADFDLWMTQEQQDFDTWYQNLQIQLSGQVATNLQRQISDLQADKLDKIRYETEVGNTDISQLGATITEAIMNSGGSRLQVTLEKETGVNFQNVICTATQDSYTLSANMTSVDTMEFSGFRELTPIEVTITYDVDFESFSITKSVSVECYKKYEMTFILKGAGPVPVGFDFQEWLRLGRVSNAYSSLEEVLENETDIRQLMTVHDSVDYLVKGCETDSDIAEQILSNDYVAKWINLRDYALDTLWANATVKAIMDSIDKYGYGEWSLMPQVPNMTDYKVPYGEAKASSYYTGQGAHAWKAFDADETSAWLSVGEGPNAWIQYDFQKPVIIQMLETKSNTSTAFGYVKEMKIQGSNDGGITFQDVQEETLVLDGVNGEHKTFLIKNTKSYQIYRLQILDAANNTHIYGLARIQFYAWQPKGNVPTMTSNSAPYGEVNASSHWGSEEDWKAFNGDSSNQWSPANNPSASVPQWIQYKFTNPICAKKFSARGRSDGNAKLNFVIQGSNDGTNFEELYKVSSGQIFNTTSDNIENDEYFMYYRVTAYDVIGFSELQFYGRALNVSVPTMKGYTDPYGEVLKSGDASGGEAWKAFDKSESSWWTESASKLGWIAYDFGRKVQISKAFVKQYGGSVGQKGFIEYTNDKDDPNSWIPASTEFATVTQGSYIDLTPIEARYWRYRVTQLSSSNPYTSTPRVDFFGVDYSEREFEPNSNIHYLYDHGVELNEECEFNIASPTGIDFRKNADEILMKDEGAGYGCLKTISDINLGNYDVIRARLGFEGILANAYIGANSDGNLATTVYASSSCNSDDKPNNVNVNIANEKRVGYPIIYPAGSSQTGIVSITEWWLE